MKIRSAGQLLELLDYDMAWRLKEIHELRSAVKDAKGKKIDTYVRAGIALLYAHWEGFIKNSANNYISYLAFKADRMCDLKPCFAALGMKARLSLSQESSKSSVTIEAVRYLIGALDQPIQLPKTDAVSTQSNLNSDVFVSILGWIGFDPAQYSTRFNLIDETLLKTRNSIAHGENSVIDAVRFESLVAEVIELLRWFKTDIENAVVQRSYLINPSPLL